MINLRAYNQALLKVWGEGSLSEDAAVVFLLLAMCADEENQCAPHLVDEDTAKFAAIAVSKDLNLPLPYVWDFWQGILAMPEVEQLLDLDESTETMQ
jgi:hypothetical protein